MTTFGEFVGLGAQQEDRTIEIDNQPFRQKTINILQWLSPTRWFKPNRGRGGQQTLGISKSTGKIVNGKKYKKLWPTRATTLDTRDAGANAEFPTKRCTFENQILQGYKERNPDASWNKNKFKFKFILRGCGQPVFGTKTTMQYRVATNHIEIISCSSPKPAAWLDLNLRTQAVSQIVAWIPHRHLAKSWNNVYIWNGYFESWTMPWCLTAWGTRRTWSISSLTFTQIVLRSSKTEHRSCSSAASTPTCWSSCPPAALNSIYHEKWKVNTLEMMV